MINDITLKCLYISKNSINVFIPAEVLAAAYEVKIGAWVRSKKLGKIFNNSETQKYSKKISKIDYPKNLESEIEKLEDIRHDLRNHECQTCPSERIRTQSISRKLCTHF